MQDRDNQRDALGSVVGRLLQHKDPGVRTRGAVLLREFIIKQARPPAVLLAAQLQFTAP